MSEYTNCQYRLRLRENKIVNPKCMRSMVYIFIKFLDVKVLSTRSPPEEAVGLESEISGLLNNLKKIGF